MVVVLRKKMADRTSLKCDWLIMVNSPVSGCAIPENILVHPSMVGLSGIVCRPV